MVVDESTRLAIGRLFPLLPWALDQMQTAIAPGIFGDLEPGTKAVVAHDLVMKEGQRRFTDPDDIMVSNASGLLHFVLPTVLLRVKRGDARSLRIATNRTNQTLVWMYQLSLKGMVDPRDFLHMVYYYNGTCLGTPGLHGPEDPESFSILCNGPLALPRFGDRRSELPL